MKRHGHSKTLQFRSSREQCISGQQAFKRMLQRIHAEDPLALPALCASGALKLRNRHILAADPAALYSAAKHLKKHYSAEVVPGIWASTNYNDERLMRYAKRIAEMAGLRWGTDVGISARADV